MIHQLQVAIQSYTVPGTYNPSLIAYSTNGCTDTFSVFTPVVVHALPEASFTVDQSAGCPGTTFTLTNTSVPDSGLSYSWSVAGVTYTDENPEVTLNNPGFYHATLVVTNQYGCTDTVSQINYIQVYDTIPPPVRSEMIVAT